MALTAEQKRAFRAFAIPLFTGAKIDDDRLLADTNEMIRFGLFPNMWQQDRNTQVMFKAQDAKDDGSIENNCRVVGFKGTNREYINDLVHKYAGKFPDERDRVMKFLLTWNGRVPGLAKAEENFNIGELRNIREFARHLVKQSQSDWFDRLVDSEVVSIGDLRLVSSFNKTTDAQSSFQNSLRGGREFKDTSDLAPHGPWKGPWGEISGYVGDIAKTIEKGQGVRDAQKDRLPDIAKELESSRKAAKHFEAETAAVQNRTFDFAVTRGDLDEYVRLSPNYNPSAKVRWVQIPEGIDPADQARIEDRIDRLTNDDLTVKVAARTGKTRRQIAELRELFFRSRDLVDRLAGVSDPGRGWGVKWMDAWDYLTEGFSLIDRIVTASGGDQSREMTINRADRIVRTIALAKIDLPGKYDLPLLSVIFFGALTGSIILVFLVATGNTNGVPAIVLGFLGTLYFHGAVKQAASRYERLPFYLLLGVVGALIFIAFVGGNLHRDIFITPALEREYEEFRKSFTR